MFETPERIQQYELLLELARDLIHFEQYGHAIPQEVRARVSRILRHVEKPSVIAEEVRAEVE